MTTFFDIEKDQMQLSPESRQAFAARMKKESYAKGHLLVKPGSTCRSMYFVEKGLTRTFYYKKGKDITDWFSLEGTIACSIISFLSQRPDRRGIELLEEAELWVLDHEDMEALCREHHEIERFTRLATAQGLLLVQERYDDLHFATAKERYQKLFDRHPSILQRAPLGMIASYLGITQETLSRIRSQPIF